MTAPVENRTSSIRTKLVLWISISLLVVGIVMVVANERISTATINQQLEQLAADVSHELVDHLAEDIWNMDDQAIGRYFVGYPWASLGLVSVRVTTEFDDVLFKETYSEETASLGRRTAVFRDGKTVGFIDVNLSKKHMLSTQRAVARSGIMIIAFAVIVIFLVTTFIVNAVVISPVRNTVSGLRRIADGDYDHKLPGAVTTEIDSINQEINTMADEIFKRQRQLKRAITTRERAELNLRELNDGLETRINKRTDQLRRLAKNLASAQDYEQKRIAEGLHDDVAQLLAASRMKITVASAHAGSGDCRALMKDIDDLIHQAYERLRLLSFELASSTLYQWGLKDSLVKLCAGMNERYDVSFELMESDDIDSYDDANATVLFKAARELLFNVVKHSGVKSAAVGLERDGDNLALTVEDRGKGFGDDVDIGTGHGLGLFSIRERLQDIGGEMKIESEPGICTRVALIVPWVEKDTNS